MEKGRKWMKDSIERFEGDKSRVFPPKYPLCPYEW